MIAPMGSAEWVREVAVSVIARQLDEPDPARALQIAERLMCVGEEAAVYRDQKLREIARDITREAGFDQS